MSLYLRILFTALFISSLAASHVFAAGEVAANSAAKSGYAPAASAPVEGGTPAAGVAQASNPNAPKLPVKPYRTWITIQRYNMENNGDAAQPISNVRLEMLFAGQKAEQKLALPESGQFWPIGNGQVQEINRNFEVPWAWIQNDGFVFTVQMVRKGSEMLPCKFEVSTLSQFNRAYVCKTDTGWQASNHIPADKHDKESIQIRVFTDLNAKPNEIPNDAIALK